MKRRHYATHKLDTTTFGQQTHEFRLPLSYTADELDAFLAELRAKLTLEDPIAHIYRHAAKLSRGRTERRPAEGEYQQFLLDATNLHVELWASDTSPLHDLPDGAQLNVSIDVDLVWADQHQPDVAHAAREFERHGRRPKFGPPLDER